MLKANCLMLCHKVSIKTHLTPSKPISPGAAPLLLRVLGVFIPSVVSHDQSLDQSDCSILATWSEALPYMGINTQKLGQRGKFIYIQRIPLYTCPYI